MNTYLPANQQLIDDLLDDRSIEMIEDYFGRPFETLSVEDIESFVDYIKEIGE